MTPCISQGAPAVLGKVSQEEHGNTGDPSSPHEPSAAIDSCIACVHFVFSFLSTICRTVWGKGAGKSSHIMFLVASCLSDSSPVWPILHV